jgi:3-hydroxybutyryl-CoA dehydrogenase
MNADKSMKVVVAGAGTMGHGLALLMARGGHEVMLVDISEQILSRAMALIQSHLLMLSELGQIAENSMPAVLGRIHPGTQIEVLSDADLVIESISEEPETKRGFYARVEALCGPEAIIASNTSYLNVFELAPESIQQRLCISHFFAPPYLIPLVEIVRGPATLHEVIDRMRSILLAAGQKPVVIEKFIPGFIVNRLQRALGREIFHLIDQGYAKPEEIDRAVLGSLGIRLPVLGVVRRYDFAGLDFALKVYSNPSIGLMNEDKTPTVLKDLVSKGHFGVKSGKGFYEYKGKQLSEIYEQRDRLLIRMRKILEEIEEDLWKP